jgi:hypothetical protein
MRARSARAERAAPRAQVYKPATPQNRRAEVMTTREYAGGRLQREDVLRVADTDLRRRAAKRDARRRLSDDRRGAGQVPRGRQLPAFYAPSGVHDRRAPQVILTLNPCAPQAARAERMGEPIASGHRSYDLMRSLQLGIVFSIARATAAPPPPGTPGALPPDAPAPDAPAELSASDFAEQARRPRRRRAGAAAERDLSSCQDRA